MAESALLGKIVLVLALCLVSACGGEDDLLDQGPGCIESTSSSTLQPSRRVVFLGDSLTARWHLPCEFQNRAVDGRDSEAVRAAFDREEQVLRQDILVLLVGTNDLLSRSQPSIEAIQQVAESAQGRGACVIVGTVPPLQPQPFTTYASARTSQSDLDERLARFNQDLATFALSRGFWLADYNSALVDSGGQQRAGLFNADGIHPNRRGHEAMFGVLSPLLTGCE
ncbi:hypothetical protein EON82_24255 [bacterium]|nr:MAG: hypothetical protein EON82_24255 [bacterium]